MLIKMELPNEYHAKSVTQRKLFQDKSKHYYLNQKVIKGVRIFIHSVTTINGA